MVYRKVPNPSNKLGQELIRVHKYGKMSATNRDKLFLRGFDQREVLLSKHTWGCEVLSSFKEEHGNSKFQSKIFGRGRRDLRNQTFAAQHLALGGVIDVRYGTDGGDECQAKCSKQELVRTFEAVGPFPLYLVPAAGR